MDALLETWKPTKIIKRSKSMNLVQGLSQFKHMDYVSEWQDMEGVDIMRLMDIVKRLIDDKMNMYSKNITRYAKNITKEQLKGIKGSLL